MAARYRVEGLEATRANLRKLERDAGKHALGAARAGGAVLIDGMRRRAPELSGDLAGTIARSVHMRSAGPNAVLVGTTHGLARIFEDGGEITAKRKKVLSDGGVVFGPRVTIPAKPFVRPTLDEDAKKAIAAAGRSAARRFRRS